jgi:hypothetical protein
MGPQCILAILDIVNQLSFDTIIRYNFMINHMVFIYEIIAIGYIFRKTFLPLVIAFCLCVFAECIIEFGRYELPRIRKEYGGTRPLIATVIFRKNFIDSIGEYSYLSQGFRSKGHSGDYAIIFDTDTRYYVFIKPNTCLSIPKNEVISIQISTFKSYDLSW